MTRSCRIAVMSGLAALATAAVVFVSPPAIAQPPPPHAAAPSAAPSHEREYANSWDEYVALKAKAHGGTQHTRDDLPDWSGLWRTNTPPEDRDPSALLAALTPKYRADYDAKRAKIAKGIEWDRLSWCLPMGMPRWLADPWLHEFFSSPNETWMLYEQLEEERRVYTDGREHMADSLAIPLWEGDSVGFWDGDTLVVHTNHLKPGEYWRGSPETSYQTSTVERMRKVNADTIETELTVYDPVSLTRPVHMTYTFKKIKDPTVRLDYASCEEGNEVYRTKQGGTDYYLPGDAGFRDPTNYGISDVARDSRPK